MEVAVQRFGCTQCGKCCNRSPEVQLSETAALADVFVFRLMFRIYWLPHQLNDYLAPGRPEANASAAFYEKKRLLNAFAARKSRVKVRRDGKAVEYAKYLMVSALALDTSAGACSALNGMRCSVYDRRPLSCRSVPFHYARAEALAETGLRSFVETAGYRCDTSEAAEVALEDGRIVAREFNEARSAALDLAGRDRPWREAIVRRTIAAPLTDLSLPNLHEIEAGAHLGVTTTSMCVAWQIASDAGLIHAAECDRLTALQLHLINRELGSSRCSQDARETLAEMQTQYRRLLNGARAGAVIGGRTAT